MIGGSITIASHQAEIDKLKAIIAKLEKEYDILENEFLECETKNIKR
jgi:hypothetical protein